MPQRAKRQSLLKHTDVPPKRKISKQERVAIERHANMKRMAEDVATDSTVRTRIEKLMAKEMVKIEALQAASHKELDDDLAAKAHEKQHAEEARVAMKEAETEVEAAKMIGSDPQRIEAALQRLAEVQRKYYNSEETALSCSCPRKEAVSASAGTKIDSGARPKASQPRVTTPAPRTVHHIHGELDQLQHGVQSLQQTYATMSEKCDQVNSVLLSLS